MIKEHDCVILTVELPAERLRPGDLGAIVHVHADGAGYEVEFMTLDGRTLGVVTLLPTQIRAIGKHQIANVRDWATA